MSKISRPLLLLTKTSNPASKHYGHDFSVSSLCSLRPRARALERAKQLIHLGNRVTLPGNSPRSSLETPGNPLSSDFPAVSLLPFVVGSSGMDKYHIHFSQSITVGATALSLSPRPKAHVVSCLMDRPRRKATSFCRSLICGQAQPLDD